MPSAAVFFADGFEEIEAVTPCDVLTRAGFTVTVVGVTGAEVKGAHKGLRLKADKELSQVTSETFDVIVLPGGLPGAKHLADSAQVIEMLKAQKSAGRWIAAICASPALTLHKKKIMEASQKGVCYTAMGKEMGENYIADEKVTTHVDGKIITSRGPGTAMEFSLTVAKHIVGEAKAKEVANALLYHHSF
eukprot:Gregarina_sp_Pseudo_9__2446@NODE_2733_length_893_cov_428_370023_g2500_i0_p1_GENE_NODE_2733_length_893_cov_428_370023_g2500_i0NODE_2733_length_893_cov_428_370023_g2500_i0_p1_ORF_typecomplete_len190_score43_83DJ1_PfpI/PF01965_24/5_1e35ThiJ_like/PF17124_5/0_43ThiJ_like/PF17124_5/1_1e06Catalase_C/PF18011_1/1_3e07GATase_3/PF07685_14/0_025LDcluster4/PF18306_1/0_037_NODE_2733_length_893_cov_428_370023_g2500_i0110679